MTNIRPGCASCLTNTATVKSLGLSQATRVGSVLVPTFYPVQDSSIVYDPQHHVQLAGGWMYCNIELEPAMLLDKA